MKSTDASASNGRQHRRAGGVTLSAARHHLRRVASRIAPHGTIRGRCVRSLVRSVRQARLRLTTPPGLMLEQVLAETPERRGIVVHLPMLDWTWMRQRPQQLMTQFAKAGYLSLFCSPRSQTDAFRGCVRADERLYLCDSPTPLYDLPHPIVLANWTGHWEMTRRFRSPIVVYDYLDDLGVSSNNGKPDRRKLALHGRLLAEADVVLATANRLHDEVRRVRPDALLCPNGVDYGHFHAAASLPIPADIADIVASGRPIIGYYGALARWFDYGLAAHAASVRKDCEFLLIGPDHDGTFASSPLAGLANVHWIGTKPYEELPAYLARFTVATIPFLVNDITKATSPIKLFEYMAGGKPIVTTDMPECGRYASVFVAHDRAEYAAMLGKAIAHGQAEDYRQLLDREARDNTWEARACQILAGVDCLQTVRRRCA